MRGGSKEVGRRRYLRTAANGRAAWICSLDERSVRGIQKSFAERHERDVETARRDPQNPARVTGAGSAFTLNASSEAWSPSEQRRGGHSAFLRHPAFS